MWRHDHLLIKKVLDTYDDMIRHFEESITSIGTGDDSMDLNLIRSEALEFCRGWQEFSNSYREAKEQDLDMAMQAIEEFNRNVNSAINVIALQRKLKDKSIDRSGSNAPNFKNINMEAFVRDYIGGASTSQLAEKYGLSVKTVILKLRSAGVYKDGRLN